MNCILYLRVSSEEQVSNFSLGNQEDYCKKEAERRGYLVSKTFKEKGASAKNITGRPELLKLLTYCDKHKDTISALLVYRLDRLARETSDYLIIRKRLAENGIKILSCTEPTGDSPTEQFIETLLASVAKLDNDIRGERTKQGLKQRFLQGYTINSPPLGYKYKTVEGKSLACPHEPEFSLLKQTWKTYATGKVSLKQLAELANQWGLRRTYKNKPKKVRTQTLSRIFNNPFYYGLLKYPNYQEEIQGKHEPMISEQLFYKVKSVRDGNNSLLGNTKRNIKNPSFPLRGLVHCTCGSNLVSGRCKGRNQYYKRYWCNKKHGARGIQSKYLDKMLLNQLSYVQPKQECVDLFMLMLKINFDIRIGLLSKLQKKAKKKEDEVKNLISSLVEKFNQDKIPEEIYDDMLKKYEDKLLAARIVKNDNIVDKYDLEGTTTFMKALLKNLPRAYEVSNYTQKRLLLGSIYPNGLVFDGSAILNPEISQQFRDIRDPQDISIPSGVADASYFEPLLAHFEQLRLIYETQEGEENDA